MSRQRVPRYVTRLAELDAAGRIPRKPDVYHVTIRHDDWCAQLRGTGECNCDFELVLPDGSVVRQG